MLRHLKSSDKAAQNDRPFKARREYRTNGATMPAGAQPRNPQTPWPGTCSRAIRVPRPTTSLATTNQAKGFSVRWVVRLSRGPRPRLRGINNQGRPKKLMRFGPSAAGPTRVDQSAPRCQLLPIERPVAQPEYIRATHPINMPANQAPNPICFIIIYFALKDPP